MIKYSSGFPTTHWSQLKPAQGQATAEHDAALNELIVRYWKPVYVYICRRGFEADAADLTQEFFLQSLRTDLFGRADRVRGRFRNFLLMSLKNFLIDAHRRQKGCTPVAGIVSIHALVTDSRTALEPRTNETPDDVFQRTWVNELLTRVWNDLQARLCDSGKETHGELFRRRVYEPALNGRHPPPLTELAGQFGLTMKEASNRIATVVRAFRKLLTAEIRRYASTEEEVQSEFRDLFRFAAASDTP